MVNNVIGEALILVSNDKNFIIDQKNRIMKRLISFQYNSNCGLPSEIICKKIIDLKAKIDAYKNIFCCIRLLEEELCEELKKFYFKYFKKNQSILNMVKYYGRSINYYYGKKKKIINNFINILQKKGYTISILVELFNDEVAVVDAYERVLNKNKRRILEDG